MAGALLRSGSLSEYHSLGAVGKPVFSAAGQLRVAIRRSTDRKTADIFAEPKQNDQGDLIDWYAPYAGNVVPWSAATPDERRAAKTELEGAKATLAALSDKYQGDEDANTERKVFGKLLALAPMIPSDEHVYLVDGRPVITFWGFHPLDAPPDLDVIGDLDIGDEPAAAVGPTPLAAAPPPAAAGGPFIDPVAPAEGGAVAAPGRAWGLGWLWFLLPLLALLLLFLLLTGLKGCGVDVPLARWLPALPFGVSAPDFAVDVPELTPVLDDTGKPVLDVAGRPVWMTPDGRRLAVGADGTAIPVGPDGIPLPDPELAVGRGDEAAGDEAAGDEAAGDEAVGAEPSAADTPDPTLPAAETAADLPAGADSPAEDAPPGAEPAPADAPPAPAGPGPATPAAPLSIPEQAARTGDTGFLDGAWRSDTGLTDSSGNPVKLNYDFKDGKGTVNLDRAVGDQRSVCTGPATPVMRDGALVITQGQIRCKDGTTFNAPKVVCTMGAGGRADCEGANEDGTTFGVDITR